MKIDEEYECNHMKGETLTVVRIHNKNMGVVRVGNTSQQILFSEYPPDLPSLCLNHINNTDTEMRKKQKELPHASN